MSIRQERAKETRAKIVAAAEKLITEKGFDAVQISDITNEAGVAKGSFYTYFERKEDVVAEITHTHFESIHERSGEQEGDVCDRISSFIVSSMEYIINIGIKIAQQWFRGIVEPSNLDGVKKLEYDCNAIKDLLDKAVGSGELSEQTPTARIAEWAASEYYGITLHWTMTDGEYDPIPAVQDFCQSMLRDYMKQYRVDK